MPTEIRAGGRDLAASTPANFSCPGRWTRVTGGPVAVGDKHLTPIDGETAVPRILLLQGANLNFLGIREPEKYGSTTAAELDAMLEDYAKAKGFDLDIFYTNSEAEMIDKLFSQHDVPSAVAVLNPGGFCYSGYALRDCMRAINLPVIEVHMTNHYARDIHSVTAEASAGVVMGLGIQTYFRAIDAALEMMRGG